MNKEIKLTKSQLNELNWILNFYLYDDGIDHEATQIDKVERIKKRFGFLAGDQL
jgi:hypothetical protein